MCTVITIIGIYLLIFFRFALQLAHTKHEYTNPDTRCSSIHNKKYILWICHVVVHAFRISIVATPLEVRISDVWRLLKKERVNVKHIYINLSPLIWIFVYLDNFLFIISTRPIRIVFNKPFSAYFTTKMPMYKHEKRKFVQSVKTRITKNS